MNDYWDEVIADPDKLVDINRKTLWAIWVALMAVDLDKRNGYWQLASEEVKKLLNSSKP